MIHFFSQQGVVFLNQTIQSDPGFIIGPISVALGAVINFFFNLISFITPVGALGFSIIIMTIIVRSALLPSSFKMQRNTMKMREMKPEMDKIKAKYGDTKDPELRRKMQAEIQALNSKHGVNMLSSCLPMLITWPLFMALFAVLGQAFMFIGGVGDAYTAVSDAIIAMGPNFLEDVVLELAKPKLPVGSDINIELTLAADLNRVIHVFNTDDWNTLFNYISVLGSEAQLANILNLYEQKMAVQSFFGLNLIAPSGLAWPGIILPVLSAGTMFLSQFLMMKTNPATDDQSKMMQKVTMVIFPLMFGFFTISASAGVGLYWTAMNVYMIVQHHFISKYYAKKDADNLKSKSAKVE